MYLSINQVVRNFGELAIVKGFHHITGDPILRSLYSDGTTWISDSDHCEPVDANDVSELRHKEGFIQF